MTNLNHRSRPATPPKVPATPTYSGDMSGFPRTTTVAKTVALALCALCQAPTFPHTQRFAFDGQSRLPNFLSYGGKEGREQSTSKAQDDQVALQQGDEGGAQQAHVPGWSALQSHKPRAVSTFSHIAGDPRFDSLEPPYSEPLGPGSYDIEVSSPPLGPFPLDCTQRSAAPARDPWRPHQAFCSPERPSLFKFSEGHHLGSYLSPDHKGLSQKSTAWSRSSDQRAEVADYRYATRHSEGEKEVPEAESVHSPRVDSGGSTVNMAASASAKATTIPFQSNQPRLSVLPRGRLNDVRLGTQRLDVDASAGGPGAYSPYISIGGAKRKTYRLYAPEQPSPALHHPRSAGARLAQPASASHTAASSAPFTAIGRAQTFGAFSPMADSTLKIWYK